LKVGFALCLWFGEEEEEEEEEGGTTKL